MNKSNLIIRGLVNAAGVAFYVMLITGFFANAERLFGGVEPPSALAPLFMLLLFIISATITGSLVLGKPILLYIEGEKKAAIILFLATISWLILFLLAVGATLFFLFN